MASDAMDSAKAMASDAMVVGPRASSSYHVAPRAEIVGSTGMLHSGNPIMIGGSERKKRGRPRKYRPDETSGQVFSPVPLSSSAPPATGKLYVEDKKMDPTRSEKRQRNKIGAEKLDGWIDCYTGSSFLPHMITVNAGEDISSKIMEFSLQGPRSVCVISGSGVVSSVTIRHPSSGGTLTYEGLFEIISFSGSFSPVEVESSKFGRSGMISISLSGADGRVVGGLVAGLTIAATPVKVIVASFLLSSLHEVKPKKQRINPLPFTVNGPDGPDEKKGSDQMQGPSCTTPNHPSDWAETSRKSTADINISLQG